jgi:hypothetical protein
MLTHIHASSRIWTHDPSVRAIQDHTRIGPCGENEQILRLFMNILMLMLPGCQLFYDSCFIICNAVLKYSQNWVMWWNVPDSQTSGLNVFCEGRGQQPHVGHYDGWADWWKAHYPGPITRQFIVTSGCWQGFIHRKKQRARVLNLKEMTRALVIMQLTDWPIPTSCRLSYVL